MSITGFDTLTSTTVKDDVLSVKFTRALPTVGCEADAIAGEVSETTYTAENGFGFPDGSYIIVPRHFDKANLRQKFSACITHPNATAAAAAGDARRRARVQFGRVDERASRVSVVLERWDSPFCDGAILPGCGGPDSSFANEDRSASDMIGKWTANVMRLSLSGEEIKSNSTEREEGVVEEMMMMKETLEIEENHTVDGFLLPRGLSIRILTHGQAQKEGNVVEVAWLVPDGGQKKCSVVRGVYTEEGILKYLEHAVGSVST